MKLALFCGFSPALVPAPALASEQVLFSPWLEDEMQMGRAAVRRVPPCHFDAADAILALDPADAPDAVAVLLDEFCTSWPRNLAALACPKVLLVADAPRSAAAKAALAEYLAQESFDFVAGLSDRRSAAELRGLGARHVAWLPGWHSPHAEDALGHGRKAQPLNRVAVCVQRGTDDRPELNAAKAAALRGLAVHARVAPCRERPMVYGTSALALVPARPGDLRLLEALAVGAPCLCSRPAPDSGWEAFFPEDLVIAYDRPEAAADIASDLLADPAEAHVLGEKGARWFDRAFSSEHRRDVLAGLALDRRIAPELEITHGTALISVAPETPAPAEDEPGRRACELAERGEFAPAFSLATESIRRDAGSWLSCLAIAEVAMETRTADLWRTMLSRARTLAPNDDHLARLELGSRGLLVEWRALRGLMECWEACAARDWKRAIGLAEGVLRRFPQCAEAAFAAGYAGLQWARQEKRWPECAAALAHLQAAADAAPHRSDFRSLLTDAQEFLRREMEEAATTEASRLRSGQEGPGCGFQSAAVR